MKQSAKVSKWGGGGGGDDGGIVFSKCVWTQRRNRSSSSSSSPYTALLCTGHPPPGWMMSGIHLKNSWRLLFDRFPLCSLLFQENGASKFGSCYYLDISNTLHPFNQSIVVILEGFFIIKAKPDELESSYMFLVQHSREYSSSLAKQEKNSTTRHTQTLTITPVFSIMLLSRRCCCYCGVNPLWAMYRSESICIYITKDCARFSLLGWMSQQQHFGLQFRPVSHVPVKMMYGIQENVIIFLPNSAYYKLSPAPSSSNNINNNM